MILLSASIVALAIAGAAWHIGSAVAAAREHDATRDQIATLLALFAPALVATRDDPRAFLVWYPIAKAARLLFPEAFRRLDEATGSAFPFPAEQIEAAHARWTADWLAWEVAHDSESKLKTLDASRGADGDAGLSRARLDAVERERLDRYQQRYAEYVRTAKALQALIQH